MTPDQILEKEIRDALDRFASTCSGDLDYAGGALEVIEGFVSSLEQLEIDAESQDDDDE
jgi:hypothetical protein